ncbi:MAG TPA: hypothetical protein VIX90_09305 [Edaphobacter sp.]
MKLCLFSSPILALLLSAGASGQPTPQSAGSALRETTTATVPRAVPEKGDAVIANVPVEGGTELSFKQQLMHLIELREAAVQRAESAHVIDDHLAKIYEELGLLYADVAMWERSETNLEHAISLFRQSSEPTDELAKSLSGLGRVHVSIGKLRQGEKEEEEAVRIRESKGDPLLIARSRNDMAELYLAQHKFAKAKDAARQAIDEFVVNEKADAFDRISARYALGLALCASKDCPSAVAPLKEAIEEGKTTLHLRDFPLGLGAFLLGYAYWKSGNMAEAGPYMEQGTKIMNEQLGWGHPIYLVALRHYAQFLRENRRINEAEDVERKIRRAEAVVDVHSLQAPGSFGIAGLR